MIAHITRLNEWNFRSWRISSSAAKVSGWYNPIASFSFPFVSLVVKSKAIERVWSCLEEMVEREVQREGSKSMSGNMCEFGESGSP